jgi:hypothetical protein
MSTSKLNPFNISLKTRLLTEKKAREEIQYDINRLKAQLTGVLEENKKMIKDTDLKKLLDKIHFDKFNEEEKYDKEKFDLKEKFIEELQAEKTNLFLAIEKDSNLQKLRHEN